MILKNHASTPIRKEKLCPTSKARRAVSRNKFVEKGGLPDCVENFGEADGSKNGPRACLRFVEPIQNELTKEQNLIESKSYRAKTGL